MKNSLISLLMMASFANLSAQTFNEQVHKWMMLQDSTASKSNEVRNIMAQVAYYYPDTTVASKGYWDTLTQKMDTMNLELMDSFVAVYRQHYDPTDLQNLIRFYESPTGKKFLTKQDLIHQEVAFARRMWQSKLVSQVIDTLKKDGLKDPREETRKDTASNSNQPVMLRTMKEANDAVYMNDLSKQIKSYEQTYQTSSIDIYSRTEFARLYNQLAWHQLVAGKYAEAEQNIEKGIVVNIYDLYLPTNLPLSFLLQGKFRDAKKHYLALKDKPFGEQGFDSYKDAFLDDLKNFEYFGLIPIARKNDVAKIRALLLK